MATHHHHHAATATAAAAAATAAAPPRALGWSCQLRLAVRKGAPASPLGRVRAGASAESVPSQCTSPVGRVDASASARLNIRGRVTPPLHGHRCLLQLRVHARLGALPAEEYGGLQDSSRLVPGLLSVRLRRAARERQCTKSERVSRSVPGPQPDAEQSNRPSLSGEVDR